MWRSASTMPSALTRNAIPANNRRIVSRAVLTALLASLLLSGCLLTRLYEFKQQFCNYSSHFSLTLQGNFRISLNHPVLLDKDVVWLAGAAPSSSQQSAQQKNMNWLVDKVLPEGAIADPAVDQLEVAMQFEPAGANFLLHEVIMDRRFAYVLAPDLLDRHAENVCRSKWLVLGRSGEIDLSDADLSGQPSRQEILDFLGQPTAILDEGSGPPSGLLYEYRLRGSKPQGRQYSFEFWHDPDSGELLRSTTSSIRFASTTDFVQKKMWVKVR